MRARPGQLEPVILLADDTATERHEHGSAALVHARTRQLEPVEVLRGYHP